MSDISTVQQDDSIIITFHTTKLNILNVLVMEKEILNLMDSRDLILNFDKVKFIDSTGFSMLHRIRIKSFTHDTNVQYQNISKELKEIFNLVGFN